MKATWIIFTVLVLGINTAVLGQITKNTSDSSWVFDQKLNAYTFFIKDESISAKNLDVAITMDGNSLPYISNGIQYTNTWTNGMTIVMVKNSDGTFPSNPGTRRFHVVVVR